MIREFDILLTENDIIYTRFSTDPDNQSVVYVSYRACIDGEWREILSYDDAHGKGNHGHRYHADGRRTDIRRGGIPRSLPQGEFASWARETLARVWERERIRYTTELSRRQAPKKHWGGGA